MSYLFKEREKLCVYVCDIKRNGKEKDGVERKLKKRSEIRTFHKQC